MVDQRNKNWGRLMLTPMISVMFAAISAVAVYGQSPDLRKPPAQLPPSCSMIVISSLTTMTGSEPYRSLRFEIEALELAQQSVDSVNKAVKESNAENTDAASAMASLLQGMEESRNKLECAAYVAGQWHPKDEDLRPAAEMLIVVYNRKARVAIEVLAHTKERFVRPDGAQNKAVLMRDAERIASMNAEQTESTTDLVDITGVSLMKSLDLSDPSAKTVEYLAMTCSEREDLLSRIKNFGGDQTSDYAKIADMIQTALAGHKCHSESTTP